MKTPRFFSAVKFIGLIGYFFSPWSLPLVILSPGVARTGGVKICRGPPNTRAKILFFCFIALVRPALWSLVFRGDLEGFPGFDFPVLTLASPFQFLIPGLTLPWV